MIRRKPIKKSRTSLAFGADHRLELAQQDDRARLRIVDSHARCGLDIEIRMTSAGPTVRVHAQAVELETAGAIAVRCETFNVEARDAIALRAGGVAKVDAHTVEVEARVGGAIVRANDDVQLLGEQVLLNCDRQPPIPRWVEPAALPEKVPLANSSGDALLIEAVCSAAAQDR